MEAFYRFLCLTPVANLHLIRSIKLRWPGFSYWTHFRQRYTNEPMDEYDISWHEICREVVGLKSLHSFSIVPVWDIQVKDQPTDGVGVEKIYEVIREIYLPLTSLPDRVDLEFAISWSNNKKTPVEMLHALHRHGRENLRLVQISPDDIARNRYTGHHYDEW